MTKMTQPETKVPKLTQGKIIILSAPSGCGKSTIINAIIDDPALDLQFSVSATNRPPRAGEVNGVNYHFLTTRQFLDDAAAGRFIEWEEVYPGRFYGTPLSEIDRITSEGHNVIMDIDVCGGVNLKKIVGARAMSLFIQPPSIASLRERLRSRGTDDSDQVEARVARAEYELTFVPQFDRTVVNDDLAGAIDEVRNHILSFILGHKEGADN